MVLGASGFIGHNLWTHLAARGWSIDRVVRSPAGGKDTTMTEDGSVRTIRTESSVDGIARAIALSRPQVVFNLAAAGVGRRVPYDEMIDGNAGVVARLLEHLDPRRTTMVVHAGSWSQYSLDNPDRDIVETDRMEPSTVYGAAKVGAELAGRTIAAEVGIAFVTLRLFNVYGPGERPSRLIPYVTAAIGARAPADLTSGEQMRDFVHVDDVVTAFEACGSDTSLGIRSFNVATGIATPVRDIATIAARAVGGNIELLRFGVKPARPDEPMRVIGDASSLTNTTGWTPQVPVDAGVRDTVGWIEENVATHD